MKNLSQKHPRIIIDPDVLEFFDLTDGNVPLAPAFYGKDADGYYYQRYWTWHLSPPYAGEWNAYLNIVRGHLIKHAGDHRDNDSVLKKYEWLIGEFNSLVVWWRELFVELQVNTIDQT